jgi:hypothetical protein
VACISTPEVSGETEENHGKHQNNCFPAEISFMHRYHTVISALYRGQLHALAALPPIPLGREAGWAPEPVLTQRCLCRESDTGRPSHSQPLQIPMLFNDAVSTKEAVITFLNILTLVILVLRSLSCGGGPK